MGNTRFLYEACAYARGCLVGGAYDSEGRAAGGFLNPAFFRFLSTPALTCYGLSPNFSH